MNAPTSPPDETGNAVPCGAPEALTESQLTNLVDVFYDRVRRHPELGPVFNAAIDDWPGHKALLVSFWSSVALGTRSYRGNPMAKHRGLPIHAAHFEQWLELWRQTAAELLPPAQAERMVEYATRIGRSLRYGVGIGERTRGLGLPVMESG